MGAASDTDGMAPLHIPAPSGDTYCTGASRLVGSVNSESLLPVRTTRLDSLVAAIAPERVTIIKVDVEGHARAVLAGAQAILATGPVIIFESLEDGLEDLLRPYGYRFWLLDEQAGGLRAAATVTRQRKDGARNYLASVGEPPSIWANQTS
jgi:hypothetical protein